MADDTEQPPAAAPAAGRPPADARVAELVDALADALALKPAARRELAAFVAALADPFPKLPLVSFYGVATRGGRANYRV
ncbi:MAG TPA: hypothetical protein VF796_26755, partial [Humisphaera sp.]